MFVCAVLGVLFSSVCSSAKKNSLSLTIGPPIVPPNSFHCSTGLASVFDVTPGIDKNAFALSCQVFAFRSVLRTNSNKSPWNSLVPDFSVCTITPPI